MAIIRFVSAVSDNEIAVDPGRTGATTLLAVAQAAGVPLLFNCEAGQCAACVVTVEAVPEAAARPPLSDNEAMILPLLGDATLRRILSATKAPTHCEGPGPELRLACQYPVAGSNLLVRFITGLGL